MMSQMPRTFARMTSMYLQIESMGLAFDHFRDASAPAVREQPESLSIIGAGNGETGFSCAISFWESLDALERSNGNPRVVEAMGGYGKWMAGPFRVESYTVVSGTYPDPAAEQPSDAWLRITTVTAAQGQLDAVISAYAERLTNAESTSPACTWTSLLAPQIGARLLAIEHWTSLAALNAWDVTAKDADQRLFRFGSIETPPERDRLTVFGLF
jgi:hypothetical protein